MSRASHKDTGKRRVNQVNENSKLKSEVYEVQRLYVQREDERQAQQSLGSLKEHASQQKTEHARNRMKIVDLEKNNDQSIYRQVLDANEIDENCTLLREAIARDEAQYEDIKLKNCRTQVEILFHDSQL